MAKLMEQQISAKDVRESVFDLGIDFEAPEGYWQPDPEVLYHHPAQAYFWKRAIPPSQAEDWRNEWLENLHSALRSRDWPSESIDAMYSYFQDPLTNPDEGEDRDSDITPVVRFRILIPGDWLVEHPNFFQDLKKLQKTGLQVKVKGKKRAFKLFDYEIYADGGPLNSSLWQNSSFTVRPHREKPSAFEGGPRDWFPE